MERRAGRGLTLCPFCAQGRPTSPEPLASAYSPALVPSPRTPPRGPTLRSVPLPQGLCTCDSPLHVNSGSSFRPGGPPGPRGRHREPPAGPPSAGPPWQPSAACRLRL